MNSGNSKARVPSCFVFAIGGTGSRVLRSLTHLLAAGVKPKNSFDIVPIIIDPHQGNDDLKRTMDVLEWYKKVRLISEPSGFFSTKICTLEGLKKADSDGQDEKTTFAFTLEGAGSKFRDYIGYGDMKDPENQALADLLFSGRSMDRNGVGCDLLDIQMEIGFVGNPNVGSVVLNQIVDSAVFTEFANKFESGNDDRIFIISSIFGGTGAAGFPCLLKNIREGKGPGSNNLKQAKVGAVSILPYFKLEQDESSAINYSDFVAKTKSALYYYQKNVTGNNSVNVMYYIGDAPRMSYANDPGYKGQKNRAHFVELAGALAIIDFLSIGKDVSALAVGGDGKATNPVCNEFCILHEVERPNFSDFLPDTQAILAKPLSQFALFRKYMKESFQKEELRGWQLEKPVLDADFLNSEFYKVYLNQFFKDFDNWLKELKENDRGFAPFNMDSDLKSFIGDREGKGHYLDKPTYNTLDSHLNRRGKGCSTWSKEKKLMDVFYDATHDFLVNHYQFKPENRRG